MTFLFLSYDEIHVLWPAPFGLAAASRYEFTTRKFTPASRSICFNKVMCISEDPTSLEELVNVLGSMPLECAYSMPTILEFTALSVKTSSGLRSLLHAMGLSPSLICAAGDGENDPVLLELARCFFAPVTTLEMVKARKTRLVNVRKTGLLLPMLDYVMDNSCDSHDRL